MSNRRHDDRTFDRDRLVATADKVWSESAVPALCDYIRIPNKSPSFDPEWREHGHMARAVALIETWCRRHAPEGTTIEVVQLEGRTPLIYMELPASDPSGRGDTVLLYGHLDKQPEMVGWEPGLSPWEPVLRDDRLYGRGSADDGYAAFASIIALAALAEQSVPRARCVVLIEACEESGSPDLPAYVEHLAERIGKPSLVVCLDSGCANYEQLWSTTSLRGLLTGTLRVQLLREGVHSGDASGVVASSFRVLRSVLDRLESAQTGAILLEDLSVEIPAQRIEQAQRVAEAIGSAVYDKFPWLEGVSPVADDPAQLILNRTWRPALAVTGAAGLPPLASAGNVLRPETAVKLSLRLPPTMDAKLALRRVKSLLESDPPYSALVEFTSANGQSGWNAPALAPWLGAALEDASQAYFGKPAMFMGEGGSIPFMGMLGEKFPEAQFLITGVLGPGSNAHGPNEFLHLPTARRLTACVAQIITDHFTRDAR
ncbi:MAG TPA: M20 family metallopeptidase [Kofleriaceae bacterium]|nr:M20 family metallopeptidase [Kofleriaceae bacterium]